MKLTSRIATLIIVLLLPVIAPAQDEVTTEIETLKQPWGEMLAARLEHAPFPDDSRTSGFRTRRGLIPFEGHYDDNTVVFVLPSGFKASRTPDLIFYFHGHTNDARKSVGQMRLGEQLEASHRNAILILPQGPFDAPDSGGGKLEKPGGFHRLVNESIATLVHAKKLPAGAKPRNIILAAHSGGYRTLAHVLEFGGMTNRIMEAWLFDAAYGNLDFIAKPFAGEGERRLRSIFTDHLADENLQLMSYLSLRGKRFAAFEEDHLTTEGTSRPDFEKSRFHSANASPGEEELPQLLRKEQFLFLHSKLTHNDVVWRRRYFRHFAQTSPNLNQAGERSGAREEESGP